MTAPSRHRGAVAEERAAYVAGTSEPRDLDLLAMVIGGADPFRRAADLLDSVGGIRGLRAASPADLTAAGLPQAAACAVAAAFEIGRRAATLAPTMGTPLRKPSDVARYVRTRVGYDAKESFVSIGLDSRQRVQRIETVAVGSLASVEVHPREFFAPLITSRCHAVIAAHNHPSGDPSPSEADLDLTRRLADAGRMLGVPLLDHVVVTTTDAVSMAALGLLPG